MDRCDNFQRALEKGVVCYNDRHRICSGTTKRELYMNSGRGGFRSLILEEKEQAPVGANASVITFSDEFDGATIAMDIERKTGAHLVAVDTQAARYGMVDANVEEKRKRDEEGGQHRFVRSRTDDLTSPMPMIVSTPPAKVQRQPSKYRYESELHRQVNVADISEKFLDAIVPISLRDMMGLSGEFAEGIIELAKRRKRPVEDYMVLDEKEATTAVQSVMVGEVHSLYACPSGRATTIVDGRFEVEALLDGGSELNVMPERVWKRLGIPIDTDINWKIGGYREGAEAEQGKGLLGVCHDVKMTIGGVHFKVPVFIVEGGASDLILGRPWERLMRAEYFNEEDGSLRVVIRQPDGLRKASFIAAPGNHERNREFVRHADRVSGKD